MTKQNNKDNELYFIDYDDAQRRSSYSAGFSYTSNSYFNYDYVAEYLSLPGVQASVTFISNSIANFPILLKKKVESSAGSYYEDIKPNDELYYLQKLINKKPNAYMDGFTFKKSIVSDILTTGNAYIPVERVGNKVVSLDILNSTAFSIDVTWSKIRGRLIKVFKYSDHRGGTNVNKRGTSDNIIQIYLMGDKENLCGIPPFLINYLTLEPALDLRKFIHNYYNKNGGGRKNIFVSDQPLNKAQVAELKASLSSKSDIHIVTIPGTFVSLNEVIDPKKINDLQSSSNNDIAKLFNLPLFVLDGTVKPPFPTVSENNDFIYRHSLQPYVDKIELALNLSLLTESQQLKYKIVFDNKEFIENNHTTKVDNNIKLLNNGIISVDEARSAIDLNIYGSELSQSNQLATNNYSLVNYSTGSFVTTQNTDINDNEVDEDE